MTDTAPITEPLVYTRIFDARRELVFRCMTEPEHLTHFWGPIGVTTPLANITIDLRIGGAFETVMVNDADSSEYAMRAQFVEIAAPEPLTWVDLDHGFTSTTTFKELDGDRTEVRIVQTGLPEGFRTPEAQAGFATSLDRFDRYLHALPREARQ
jgi:uncharacterized protein YndB with AHSA1/START domain